MLYFCIVTPKFRIRKCQLHPPPCTAPTPPRHLVRSGGTNPRCASPALLHCPLNPLTRRICDDDDHGRSNGLQRVERFAGWRLVQVSRKLGDRASLHLPSPICLICELLIEAAAEPNSRRRSTPKRTREEPPPKKIRKRMAETLNIDGMFDGCTPNRPLPRHPTERFEAGARSAQVPAQLGKVYNPLLPQLIRRITEMLNPYRLFGRQQPPQALLDPVRLTPLALCYPLIVGVLGAPVLLIPTFAVSLAARAYC